ncbi:uncharacterized protein CXorf38-like isoform X1 [Sardina pilchardus]|uniref:uncharacterized protein CXorf38-like isoform X1 n=1 Tax=Sardina pilchardus TaxID=27697 RepID=UPI002E0FF359
MVGSSILANRSERSRNWNSVVDGLRALRCLLRNFLENQTELFLKKLLEKMSAERCENNCEIRKPNELLSVCEVCQRWSRELQTYHTAKGSFIHWTNCNPQHWPEEKWEVAKAYMSRCNPTAVKFDDFDISALISLMSRCTYFQLVIPVRGLQKLLLDVAEVRNKTMHSPDCGMSREELNKHLETIKCLGRELEPYAPEMTSLSEDIDKLLLDVAEVRNKTMHSPDCGMSREELNKHLETIKCLGRELEPYAPEMTSLSEDIDKVSIQSEVCWVSLPYSPEDVVAELQKTSSE